MEPQIKLDLWKEVANGKNRGFCYNGSDLSFQVCMVCLYCNRSLISALFGAS